MPSSPHRNWVQSADTLQPELRFPPKMVAELIARGHDADSLICFYKTVRHPDAELQATSDP